MRDKKLFAGMMILILGIASGALFMHRYLDKYADGVALSDSVSETEPKNGRLGEIFTNKKGEVYGFGIFTRPGVTFNFSFQRSKYDIGEGNYMVRVSGWASNDIYVKCTDLQGPDRVQCEKFGYKY